jgi:hypothetical protein
LCGLQLVDKNKERLLWLLMLLLLSLLLLLF